MGAKSRIGVYFGHSPFHTRIVSLVFNPIRQDEWHYNSSTMWSFMMISQLWLTRKNESCRLILGGYLLVFSGVIHRWVHWSDTRMVIWNEPRDFSKGGDTVQKDRWLHIHNFPWCLIIWERQYGTASTANSDTSSTCYSLQGREQSLITIFS